MSRPRLLIPITIQFGVRYVLRTGLLARVAEYAQPVLALAWEDAELRRELEALGAEVHRLPTMRGGVRYHRLRTRLNLRHAARLASPSTAIDERRANLERPLGARARRDLRNLLFRLELAAPGRAGRVLAAEHAAVWSDTNVSEFSALLAAARPDAVFSLTPFLPDEELLLRAARAAGVPLCTAILSFDNITTRGWIPVTFDRYLLWNRYNAQELLRAYPEVGADRVTVVGAPQFDFYRDGRYVWDEAEWRRRLALPPGRPVILYGGGYRTIVPHEPHFVAQLDDAVERGEIPGRPVVLFRRHPVESEERWLPVLRRARHVVADDPWPSGGGARAHTNVRHDDIAKLVSTLRHSDVHVNVSSTMTVDGAIFDRPQVGPAYDDRPGGRYDRVVRELYEREHYLPITRSGGLDLAYGRAAMVDAVRHALGDPGRLAEGRRRLVREICTFDDGRATERVDDALRAFVCGRAAAVAPAAPFGARGETARAEAWSRT